MLEALFPYTRQVGRREYALRLLLSVVVSAPVLWWRWQVVRAQQATEAFIFVAVLIVVLAVIQAQLIGRLRDMAAPIVISVLVFVPYVNAALALALLFFPSQTRAQAGHAAPPGSEAAGG